MEADVTQIGDSITIRIGNYQKGVVLPTFLAGMRVARACFKEQWLVVEFRQREPVPVEVS